MKIVNISFDKIQYLQKEVSQDLIDSILRISLSFPIKVRKLGDIYECIDGHKRLSAIAKLLKKDASNTKLQIIPCVLFDATRTDNGWSRMRHH